jgi:hypothetical protein
MEEFKMPTFDVVILLAVITANIKMRRKIELGTT